MVVLEILIISLLIPASVGSLCLWSAIQSGGVLASVKQLKDMRQIVTCIS